MKNIEKHQKKTFTEAHTATKKGWVMVLFIFISLFLVGTVAAWDWDNKKYFEPNTEIMGKITIRNSFLGLFPTGKVAEYTVTKNENSLFTGVSEGTVMLYSDVKLFDDLKFKDKKGRDKNYSVTISYGINESIEYIIKDYKEICDEVENGTVCNQELIGTHNETRHEIIWRKYNFKKLPKGEYLWRIEGEKELNKPVDWILSGQGKEFKEWAWWNENWHYKKPINFSLTGNPTVDDFQARIYLTWNESYQNDFDDIRFTNLAEDTELSYFIQSKSDGNWADIWVRLPTNVTTANQTLAYLYYNNPGAPSQSNNYTTFPFFDDFDAVNLTKWDAVAGSQTIDSGEMIVNSDQVVGDTSFGYGYAFETRVKGSGDNGGVYIQDEHASGDTLDMSRYFWTAFQVTNDGSSTTDATVPHVPSAFTIVTIATISSSSTKLYLAGVEESELTSNNPTDALYPSSRSWVGDTTITFDWYRVRGYNDSVILYSLGAEEVSFIIPTIILIAPAHTSDFTTSNVTFNVTVTDDVEVSEVNLFINGLLNNTNTSLVNGTYIYNLDFIDGNHNWSIGATDDEDNIANSSVRTFTIDTTPGVILVFPSNNSYLTSIPVLFNVTVTATDDVKNVTLFIDDILNETNSSGISGEYIFNKSLADGSHNWSIKAMSSGGGINQSETWIFDLQSFKIGVLIHNNQTWETATEIFSATFSIREGTEIALAQLIYNETNYTITNLSQSGASLNLTKIITVPLNTNPLANETKTFQYKFTYNGVATFETESFEQNVSFINFQKCNATYNTQALNFTFFDEINQTNINASANPTSFESSWKYWVGVGDIYKIYPFQNLTSSINNYQFCIYPYLPNNYTFKANGDIEFSATTFRENEYHLRNATLTDISNDNLLYLLHTDYATKFFLTFKKGTNLIKGATITIQKYFTGLSEFKTVGIQFSDDNGESTMWGEVDKTYKFFIVQDGELLGTVERNAICAVAPCTLSIMIEEVVADLFEAYYETFGQNIVSTLYFNKTSKIIFYDFVDTTGLANYFRLKVQRVMLNETKDVICNSQSFATAGSLTCNLSGKIGEFKATTYVSRSPELIDKVLSVITDEDVLEGLGLMGVFLVMALIITIVFAAAIIGRGSPSVVLWALAASIVLLKLAHLFPFTWAVVITLEVIIFFLISQVKN